MPKLKIIRGLPGSGKTTTAKDMNGFHLELDMARIFDGEYKYESGDGSRCANVCKNIAIEIFKSGCDLIVSNTFTRIWEMQWYLDMAEQFGYNVEVIHRIGKYRSVHNVPEEAVDAMRNRWEPYPGEVSW